MNNTNHNVIGIWVLIALVLVSTVVLMEPDTLLLFILSSILGYIYYFASTLTNYQRLKKVITALGKFCVKVFCWTIINIIRFLSFIILVPVLCVFFFIIGSVCLIFYLLGQVFIKH